MNRVWLCLSILIVSLAGSQWLAAPARGENDSPYPAADAGYNGQNGCPYVEKMRAYGECQWYYGQEYHHDTLPDVTEAVTDNATSEPAAAEAVAEEPATAASEAPVAASAEAPAECWYDAESDTYYDYEFSNAEMVREESNETATEADATYAAEASDESVAEDWSGSYEFPSEEAASEQSDEEMSWVEDLPEADASQESISRQDESTVETVCGEPAAETAPTTEAADVATEEAWHSKYDYEYSYPGEGMEYPYGNTSESETAATEETAEEAAMDEMADDASVEDDAWQDDEYSDYSEPVQAWDDADADVEVVQGEDSDEVAGADLESRVLLSLARTLDRVGSTLQSLSRQLSDMATANVANRHSESWER